MENALTIHSDGGARGNPGPGACAFIVEQNGRVVTKGSKYLGKVTNNFAEYSGVLLALDWLLNKSPFTNHHSPIIFLMDSELVVRQLTGLYKVKDENLKKLFTEVKKLTTEISSDIIFKNIPREQNKPADLLVNEELDNKASGNFM
ncbi:MAG: Ribonuclease HI [Candidatus Woesebacteria bacterium GW2011_GWA2_40_7b]|uniref:Ribonuclease HI n=1 Tax=Candidatus Woesebacteria bacterium GW2011_GWA2_40_7b TaxID=1618563 RepID=A0A0G0VFE6_9BACT|nr:MAG: Ribonuclease HI [Candidatus Woesebacteria bacterium GW2011_GWA2_40_7b]